MIKRILSWFVRPRRDYVPLNQRCWVCGELLHIYCNGIHANLEKKRMRKHLKRLGYTHGIP